MGNFEKNGIEDFSFVDLAKMLWQKKITIFVVTFVSGLIGALVSCSLPDLYKTRAVLVVAQDKNSGGISSISSSYAGLAAVAGLSIGDNSNNRIDQAITLAKSWYFIDLLTKKYNLKPLAVAADGWDKDRQKLIYNSKIYDEVKQGWKASSAGDESYEPSSYEVYEAIVDNVDIEKESNGLVVLEVKHVSPEVAVEWINMFLVEINRHFRESDIDESKKNIQFLEKKISETSIAEMKTVFFSMIEEQTKTLMLAEVSAEYVLKTVVPAKVPEKKSSPNRTFITGAAMLLGLFLSIFFLMTYYLIVQGEKIRKGINE